MTRAYVWRDSFICVTGLIHMCDVTHSYVCVTWLIHTCAVTHSYVWCNSFICVPWVKYVLRCVAVCCSVLQCVAVCCSVLQCVAVCCIVTWLILHEETDPLHTNSSTKTPSPSLMQRTWLIHMCEPTHSYVRHDSYTWDTTLLYTNELCRVTRHRDMPHSYVWHDSFICVTWLILRVFTLLPPLRWHDSFNCVTWLIHMWRDLFTCVTLFFAPPPCTHIQLFFLFRVFYSESFYPPSPRASHVWHLYVWHYFTHRFHDPWLILICDMAHSYVWHVSSIRVTWLSHMARRGKTTHSYVSHSCV